MTGLEGVDIRPWSLYASQAMLKNQTQIEQKMERAAKLPEFKAAMKNWASSLATVPPPSDLDLGTALYQICVQFDLLAEVTPKPSFLGPKRSVEREPPSGSLKKLAAHYANAG